MTTAALTTARENNGETETVTETPAAAGDEDWVVPCVVVEREFDGVSAGEVVNSKKEKERKKQG